MNRRSAKVICCLDSRRAARRGFVLIYMLVFISLFMVAAMMFTHLMRSTMKASNGAQAESASLSAVDQLTSALRQDVWNASDINVTDQHSLQLTQGNHVVTWKFGSDSAVRTQQGTQQPDRKYTVGGITVAGRAANVTLTIPTPSTHGGGQYAIASQLLLAQAGAR